MTFFRPLVYPVIYGFVPELGVLGLEDPVAFVGEVEHFAGHVEELQGVEELEAFAYVEAVIELAVDDERGRLEVFGGEREGPLAEGIFVSSPAPATRTCPWTTPS